VSETSRRDPPWIRGRALREVPVSRTSRSDAPTIRRRARRIQSRARPIQRAAVRRAGASES
jgi:hypothetical protein